MSGFARYPMYTWGQISLMLLRSYGVLREKIKILDFDKKCLAGI
ncbi:hypothetical protein HMPREF1384_02136 [Staphylococcus aureus subsp. aureus CM05]|uniref:Uncharacterized protein n=1 Tax=Staphylococcus aureus TaxID=1280 RepID=D2JKS4_STAAU|nr:hypothetical protein SAP084B_021 [Staphylococcus aureus]ADA80986.1 hypothetical protein SAP086A_024 [Staphylococcus aureus]EFW31672.1 hypothetical protein HMPREF9528_01925 [Staphylococcus aureus subsp. aureus MRSA131]EJU82049.1 hypothetical protein HMPREF1384_02136 [Staphylococcus aureus subsp. aureus CM05]